MSQSDRVRIFNPLPGQHPYMARHRAEKAVKRGVCRWRGGLIEIIEDDYRSISAVSSLARTHRPMLIDGGMASLEQIEGLPCAGDAVKAIMGRRVTT